MYKLIRASFVLSVVGTLFASAVTLRGYIAPATEPGIFSCVGFKILGYSPCPYGLTLFALLAIVSGYLLYGKNIAHTRTVALFRVIALAGLAFSGWVGYRELVAPALALGSSYWEIFSIARVPACVWGYFVFLAVAILSFCLPWQQPPKQPNV